MPNYTEEDIQKAVHFLKTNHPEIQATREEAIKLLKGMQSFSKSFVKTVGKMSKNQTLDGKN